MCYPVDNERNNYVLFESITILVFLVVTAAHNNANASLWFHVPKNIIYYYGNRDLSRPKIYLIIITWWDIVVHFAG